MKERFSVAPWLAVSGILAAVLFGGCGDGDSPTPAVTVTSPNGAETWVGNGSASVTWTSEGTVGDVLIELSTDGGASWAVLVPTTGNDGSEVVRVPDSPSALCRVRVAEIDGDPRDASDADFAVEAAPAITVTAPNGREIWVIGTNATVTWTSDGSVGNVAIQLSTDAGLSWRYLVTNTPNDGSEPAGVPSLPGDQCLVRISELDGSPSDLSDVLFTIKTQTITETLPDGAEEQPPDSRKTVASTATETVGDVMAELSTDGGTSLPSDPENVPWPPTREIVEQCFRGRLMRFDPGNLEVELLYDFSDEEQAQDWFLGKGIPCEGAKGDTVVEVIDGALHVANTGAQCALLRGVFTSVSVQVDFEHPTGEGSAVLLVCADTEGDLYALWGASRVAHIGKYVGGGFTDLSARHPSPFASKPRGSASLSFAEGHLEGLLGDLVVTAEDGSHSSGHVGFDVGKGYASFDNLRVVGILDSTWLRRAVPEAAAARAAAEKVAEEEAHGKLKEARSKLNECLGTFFNLAIQARLAEARELIDASASDPDMASFSTEFRAAGEVLSWLKLRDLTIRRAASQLVGKRVDLQTRKEVLKGKVERVTTKGVVLVSKIVSGRQVLGETRRTVPWSDLSPLEEARLLADWKMEGTDGEIANALLSLAHEDTTAARHALGRADDHPLAEHVRQRFLAPKPVPKAEERADTSSSKPKKPVRLKSDGEFSKIAIPFEKNNWITKAGKGWRIINGRAVLNAGSFNAERPGRLVSAREFTPATCRAVQFAFRAKNMRYLSLQGAYGGLTIRRDGELQWFDGKWHLARVEVNGRASRGTIDGVKLRYAYAGYPTGGKIQFAVTLNENNDPAYVELRGVVFMNFASPQQMALAFGTNLLK